MDREKKKPKSAIFTKYVVNIQKIYNFRKYIWKIHLVSIFLHEKSLFIAFFRNKILHFRNKK